MADKFTFEEATAPASKGGQRFTFEEATAAPPVQPKGVSALDIGKAVVTAPIAWAKDFAEDYKSRATAAADHLKRDAKSPYVPVASEGKAVMDLGEEFSVVPQTMLDQVIGRPAEIMSGGIIPHQGASDVAAIASPFAEAGLARDGGILRKALDYAGRGLNRMTGQTIVKPDASAVARLRDTLQADKLDPAAIEAEVKRFTDHGVTPNLVNVAGPNTKALIRTASSKMGTGAREVAVTNQKTTRANLPSETRAKASGLTADKRPLSEVRKSLEEERDNLAEAQYRAPYAQPVAVTPEITAEIRDPEGRSAVNQAIKAARARKDYQQVAELQALLKHLDAAEKPVPLTGTAKQTVENPDTHPAVRERILAEHRAASAPPAPTVSGGSLDRIRIALDKRGRFLSKNGQADVGAGFHDRADKLGAHLDTIPHLKDARATYHGLSNQLRAADISENVLTADPAEFGRALKGMDPKSVEVLKVANRQLLTKRLGKNPNAVSRLLDTLANSPNARENLAALYGPDEGAKFADAMELHLRRLQDAHYVSPNTGSQSIPRASDEAVAEGAKTLFGAVTRPLHTLAHKAGELASTMSDAERDTLAHLGLSDLTKNPDVLSRVLAEMRRTAPATPVPRPVHTLARAAAVASGAGGAQGWADRGP